MRKLLIILLLVSNSAVAQTIPSEYVLRVTPAELDVISDGLQTQPFGKVANLMNKLRAQILEQQQPKHEDKKDGGTPEK
jgi:hypothetical protein